MKAASAVSKQGDFFLC